VSAGYSAVFIGNSAGCTRDLAVVLVVNVLERVAAEQGI